MMPRKLVLARLSTRRPSATDTVVLHGSRRKGRLLKVGTPAISYPDLGVASDAQEIGAGQVEHAAAVGDDVRPDVRGHDRWRRIGARGHDGARQRLRLPLLAQLLHLLWQNGEDNRVGEE